MSFNIGVFKAEQMRITQEPANTDWFVLSLMQPWASALFIPGLKTIETRGWRTNYRGRLYIHASKGFPKWAREFADEQRIDGKLTGALPLGVIIGHVELIGMQPTATIAPTISRIESEWGDYEPGRWAWITSNPVLLSEPIPATGQWGIWNFSHTEAA